MPDKRIDQLPDSITLLIADTDKLLLIGNPSTGKLYKTTVGELAAILGAITLDPIGSTPNADAATLTAGVLNLEPASFDFGGVVTASDTPQAFKGEKDFYSVTANILQAYGNAVLRTKLLSLGIQQWFLNDGAGEAGSVAFTTPIGAPGIAFYNTSGTGRSQIRQFLSTGGIAIGSETTGSAFSGSHLVILTNGHTFITGDATLVAITDTAFLLNVAGGVQMTSTTRGFSPPRMTTTQRDAIATPVAGEMIYNTTTNKLNVFTTAWEAVTSS